MNDQNPPSAVTMAEADAQPMPLQAVALLQRLRDLLALGQAHAAPVAAPGLAGALHALASTTTGTRWATAHISS